MRFVVYQSRDGWRWRLIARNNRCVASGEGHPQRRSAVRACVLVRGANEWPVYCHGKVVA